MLELVQVLFIKTALLVQGIMEFISRDAGVTAAVQIGHKLIHQVEKIIFVQVFVRAVEPVDLVAPDQAILYRKHIVSNARRFELLVIIKGNQICFQVGRQAKA